MAEELTKTRHHVTLQEDEDALIATLICDVGQGPADVVKDLLNVRLGKDFGKGRDGTLNLLEGRGRLTLAQVGKRPDCIAHKGGIGGGSDIDKIADLGQDVHVEKSVAEARVVTGNVTQTPDRLLLDLDVRRGVHN